MGISRPSGMPASRMPDARGTDKIYDDAYEKAFAESDPRRPMAEKQVASHRLALDAVARYVTENTVKNMIQQNQMARPTPKAEESIRKSENKRYQPFIRFVKDLAGISDEDIMKHDITTLRNNAGGVLSTFRKRRKN